jgi:Ca-activated chloride channel homolog
MGFIYPQVLWCFILLMPLVMFWGFLRRRRENRLEQFTVRENWALLNNQVSTRARFHKGVLILLALSFSILAGARPYWGTREREVRREGTNIIFAVDISQSMRARDVKPSRLEYAKMVLRQILHESKGNRIGLMPFAGEAFLQCPLTTDHSILQDMLRRLSYDVVQMPGTNIPQVLESASEAFDRSGSGNRLLVLITDGEDHSEETMKAAELAAEAEIKIFALGIGTPEGSPIRLADNSFLEADDGTKVLSKLNAQVLRDLADKTGGRAYIAGPSGRIDPTPLIRDIKSATKEDLGEEKRIVREERFQWPLLLAILCLMIEAMIGDRRRQGLNGRKKRPVRSAKGGVA